MQLLSRDSEKRTCILLNLCSYDDVNECKSIYDLRNLYVNITYYAYFYNFILPIPITTAFLSSMCRKRMIASISYLHNKSS